MKLDIEADIERIKMRCIKKMTAGDEALVAVEALTRLKRIKEIVEVIVSADYAGSKDLEEILRLCGVNHEQ